MLIALFQQAPPGERVETRLHDGLTIEGVARYGEFPGTSRVGLILRLHSRVLHRFTFSLPKETWAETGDPGHFPTFRWIDDRVHAGKLLFLTLQEESGVYGYRMIRAYRVRVSRRNKLAVFYLGKFGFSDFGSWVWLGHGRVLTWEADLSEAPHTGEHHYEVRWLTVGRKLHVTSIRRMARKYNPGYAWNVRSQGNGFDRPLPILAKNDPLREFGMKWRWWGLDP